LYIGKAVNNDLRKKRAVGATLLLRIRKVNCSARQQSIRRKPLMDKEIRFVRAARVFCGAELGTRRAFPKSLWMCVVWTQ
jgi:hypothetical protein